MVGVQVRDEDRGDLGQSLVHVVAVVAAELTEGSLATVQQQRLSRASTATNNHEELRSSGRTRVRDPTCLPSMDSPY